jgi:ABC-type transporter Mla subunit MlaD
MVEKGRNKGWWLSGLLLFFLVLVGVVVWVSTYQATFLAVVITLNIWSKKYWE